MPSEQHEPAQQRPEPERREMVPSPRASDADRDAALERLRDAFADGRLTEEEFDQRSCAALAGRTAAELERLLVDLPAVPRPAGPATRAERPVQLTLGILGDRERRWRWRIAPRSTAIAVFGACRLDLRGAKLSAAVTTITAIGVMGGFDVVVPPGSGGVERLRGLLRHRELPRRAGAASRRPGRAAAHDRPADLGGDQAEVPL
jgi:hypothetical protein